MMPTSIKPYRIIRISENCCKTVFSTPITTAAINEPVKLPMPPKTTSTRISIDLLKVNISGLMT